MAGQVIALVGVVLYLSVMLRFVLSERSRDRDRFPNEEVLRRLEDTLGDRGLDR